MFFILSKITAYFLKPLIWILIVLIWGLITKNVKTRKRAIIAAIGLLILFTNKFIFNSTIHFWEMETLTADQIESPYDIGVLLGGYSAPVILPNHDRHNFSERANRFNNAIELYFSGKIKKLLLTGGSGGLIKGMPSEAEEIYDYLIVMGIPPEDIIVESKSRNTRENAKFTAEIIQKNFKNSSILLITSAWHLPRASRCFQKVGLKFDPFGADHMTEDIISLDVYLLPSTTVINKWEFLLKEWVGFFGYWANGYI